MHCPNKRFFSIKMSAICQYRYIRFAKRFFSNTFFRILSMKPSCFLTYPFQQFSTAGVKNQGQRKNLFLICGEAVKSWRGKRCSSCCCCCCWEGTFSISPCTVFRGVKSEKKGFKRAFLRKWV